MLKKADIDPAKRAGELTEDEIDKIITIMQNPRQYKIPDWFLNRQKDIKDGQFSSFAIQSHSPFYFLLLEAYFPKQMILWQFSTLMLNSIQRCACVHN